MDTKGVLLCLDVGGTNTRIGLFDPHGGKLLKKTVQDTSVDFEEWLSKTEEQTRKLVGSLQILGLSACFPGIVNGEGMLVKANNLPMWEGIELRTVFENIFQCDAVVTHDVGAAALGELENSTGKNEVDFVYISWGTGIGGAVLTTIMDKIQVKSFQPGHVSLDWNGKVCSCGQQGCIEAYIGGKNLAAFFEGTENSSEKTDQHAWQKVIEIAAFMIYNTVHFHPTDLIVMSGGVPSAHPYLIEKINKLANQHLKHFSPIIRSSAHGEDNPLFGCFRAYYSDVRFA